jgi:hypothetical protein
MLRLPPVLNARYRLATSSEVHSWSFGLVKTVRRPPAISWEQCIGTLDDQGIFGPLRDFECACGKYWGAEYRGMICDRCGVKVTVREQRRRRFGHIELLDSIPHPLGDESDMVGAIPVLPAVFFESPAGRDLRRAYEDLIEAVTAESWTDIVAGLKYLVDYLLPVATLAHEWDLAESSILARGLILEIQNEGAESDFVAER